MNAFFQDLFSRQSAFLLPGLAAGLLASLACGVVGPYVVTRRIVFLSGAIAHTAIGGIGTAVFLAATLPGAFGWLEPVHGAMVAAILSAVLIGVIHERVAERMDTLIGALWAIGMATGVLLLKYTPGYQGDLMNYLFGSLAFVHWSDVRLMLALNGVILVVVLIFHKRLLAVCLDRQQAELQGINVLMTDVVLLCLVALTVICLTQVVGLILVIAMLSLPTATAMHYVSRMGPLFVLSTLLCALTATLPRMAVYGTNATPESAIVLTAGGVYLLSTLVQRLRGCVPAA